MPAFFPPMVFRQPLTKHVDGSIDYDTLLEDIDGRAHTEITDLDTDTCPTRACP